MGSTAQDTKGQTKNRNAKDVPPPKPKYAGFAARSTTTKIVWDELEAHDVLAAIMAVTEDGDALTFGKTRDGGALVLTVLSGSGHEKAYFTSASDATDLLQELAR